MSRCRERRDDRPPLFAALGEAVEQEDRDVGVRLGAVAAVGRRGEVVGPGERGVERDAVRRDGPDLAPGLASSRDIP